MEGSSDGIVEVKSAVIEMGEAVVEKAGPSYSALKPDTAVSVEILEILDKRS